MAAETERPRFESGLPITGFIILGELFNLSVFLLCLLEFIIRIKRNAKIVCEL